MSGVFQEPGSLLLYLSVKALAGEEIPAVCPDQVSRKFVSCSGADAFGCAWRNIAF